MSTGTTRMPTMTKIVCTLGPSSDTQSGVSSLVSEGMSVCRLNFSHVGSYEEPAAKIQLVRRAPGIHGFLDSGKPKTEQRPPNLRAIMLDTKGPEIRTKELQNNAEVLEILQGSEIIVTSGEPVIDVKLPDNQKCSALATDYEHLSKTVSVGGNILLDDGLIALRVEAIETNGKIRTKALNTGNIKKRKGVNLPGCNLLLPALTEKDRSDLKWGVDNNIDAVAASFIRNAANVRAVIAHLDRCCAEANRKIRPMVISKIESQEGVQNFSEILEASDGIMVARGDLGVEIPFEDVFLHQKKMVRMCNQAGKPVIVATQMLDSMQTRPRPTRAEVSDVANAVLDGSDTLMLSGETAAGEYPIQSIQAMRAIANKADNLLDSGLSAAIKTRGIHSVDDEGVDAVASSAVSVADELKAKIIIAISSTGKVPRALAKMRPSVPVIAFVTDEAVARQLNFHRAVQPILLPIKGDTTTLDAYDSKQMTELRTEALRTCSELGWIKSSDRVVVVDRKAGSSTADKYHGRVNLLVLTVS